MPPRSPVPQTIEDLRVFSRNGQIVLQWSAPKKDTDGLELVGLSGFRVWRRVSPLSDDECPTCPRAFDLIADIDYLNLPPEQKKQREITFWDEDEKEEVRYRYAVTTYSVEGRASEESNPATVSWVNPPPSPECLNARSGDRDVGLAWDCDQRTPGVEGFNVYRRAGSEGYPITPVNAEPVQESVYSDFGVSNGMQYFYVVRALRKSGDLVIEGVNSPEVMVIPEDRTPPAPPTTTMAFQTAEGVVVVWEPSHDRDVAGYYVYRRMVGTETRVKVSTLIETAARFMDSGFTPGRVYYSSVTAADRATQENESSFSRELRVETSGD